MKIRSGFVSNSSSSSFIVFGVYLDSEPNDMSGIDSVYLEHSDKYAVGYIISDSEEIPDKEIEFYKLEKWCEILSEKLKIDKNEMKLITGVRYC
jgi:hypothetical protein